MPGPLVQNPSSLVGVVIKVWQQDSGYMVEVGPPDSRIALVLCLSSYSY